jgi:DtxR family transcriptional regulator, Mn-dependent transcriptional regulator
VDAEAHRLEHAVSNAFEDRMDRLCGYPTRCPHGDPIPRKDGTLPNETLRPLHELSPGESGILRRVGVRDARILRYLSRLDLEPGQAVRLVDVGPFRGPVTLEVLGRPAAGDIAHAHGSNGTADGGASPATQILGHELAEQLYVLAA